MDMAKDELLKLKLNLQKFADSASTSTGEDGTSASAESLDSNPAGDSESAFKEKDSRIAELEKELAEREKKYDKLKSTMDVKLKELGDMTKRERERMTAEEREKKEIEEIKAQNELLLKEREIVSAEKRFITSGCDSDLASEGAKALIEADYDTLFTVIDKLVANAVAGEKSELLKTMPKPQGGSSSTTMTQEQFDNLNYKDLVALKEKDPETYNKFK